MSGKTRWSEYWVNDLLLESQQARFRRALEVDGSPLSINVSIPSAEIKGTDEVYTVRPWDCSCIDFRVNKLPCKHMYQLALELELLDKNMELPRIDNRYKPRYVGPKYSYPFKYKKKTKAELATLVNARTLILDTETTGMSLGGRIAEGHEILQLAIIDDQGELIHNQYYKPKGVKSWEEAQDIHGISPAHVKDATALWEHRAELQQLFDMYDYIGIYNANFDMDFLNQAGFLIEDDKVICLMRELTVGDGSFLPLEEQASRHGFELSGAHDAYYDCHAALACFNGLKASVANKPENDFGGTELLEEQTSLIARFMEWLEEIIPNETARYLVLTLVVSALLFLTFISIWSLYNWLGIFKYPVVLIVVFITGSFVINKISRLMGNNA